MSEPEWKQFVPPSTPLGEVPLNDDALQHDWKVCDGYISYSAELLRISLLAISGLAALCLKVQETKANSSFLPIHVFLGSFIALVTAASLSLLHRYLAIDSMAYQIDALRRRKRDRPEFTVNGEESDGEVARPKTVKSDADRADRQELLRKWLFRASYGTLMLAALALMVGIGLAVSAMQNVQLVQGIR